MRPSRRPLIIATRRSPLALAQARAVARALSRLHPNVDVQVLPLESEGDRSLSGPVAPAGGKGLFTHAIEAAVLDERADVAVHSLKDVPVEETPGLVLAAFPKRGDVRDCLIGREDWDLQSLPQGATVGSSSLRRQAQLLRRRPDLQVKPIRGNIDTRVAKVQQQNAFDATLLAVAGLQRNGMSEHVRQPLETDVMLPAAGQAALAIQARVDDHVTLRRLLALNDSQTATCVASERRVVTALEADCRSPLAVLAERDGDELRLRVRALSADGAEQVEVDRRAALGDSRKLTDRVIEALLAEGARDVLAAPSRN